MEDVSAPPAGRERPDGERQETPEEWVEAPWPAAGACHHDQCDDQTRHGESPVQLRIGTAPPQTWALLHALSFSLSLSLSLSLSHPSQKKASQTSGDSGPPHARCGPRWCRVRGLTTCLPGPW
eukprot:scaffold73551_cov28-Tisochrysis_lutea.AAC.1